MKATGKPTLKKVEPIAKGRKKKVPLELRAINDIFKDHPELFEKLKVQAKKNFRTPREQLIYYTWKCIEFMEN